MYAAHGARALIEGGEGRELTMLPLSNSSRRFARSRDTGKLSPPKSGMTYY